MRRALLAGTFVLAGSCGGDSFPADVADAIDAAVNENAFLVYSPGFTVAVRLPGKGTYTLAYGVANADTQVPLEPDDRFRVGSITKTFVAATLLRLEDAGTVDLAGRVNVAASDFGLPDSLTYLHLMGHTGGLFNFTDDAMFLNVVKQPWTPSQIVTWALDANLSGHGYVFAPGTDYQYSNTGYQVLGIALESLTSRPLHEVLHEHAIDVVGLRNTGLDRFDAPLGSYVDGHLGAAVATADIEASWTWAAGGLVSNGEDLCTWADALLLGDLLSPEDRARLTTPSAQSIASGDEEYGLGVRTTTCAGRTVLGHTGSTMGFRADLFLEPTTGICVAVLANDFFSAPAIVAEAVWAVLPTE